MDSVTSPLRRHRGNDFREKKLNGNIRLPTKVLTVSGLFRANIRPRAVEKRRVSVD